LAGIIIAGALYFNDGSKAVAPAQTATSTGSLVNINTNGEPFIGNPNAPVTIAIWLNYKCPVCKYEEQNFMPSLVNDYVKAGKVKVIFKDLVFLGPDSQTLALTARAIWESYPDKYYDWHKTIFDNQGDESKVWATSDVIASLTKKVGGIDQAVVDGLLAKNSAGYASAISADEAEATKLGITGTPSFEIFTASTLVTAQPIVGVPQYAQLKALIDPLLTK